MLLARGDHRANYTDIENNYDAVQGSVIMNIQAEFDQLIHSLTTEINEVLGKAAGVKTGDLTLADGTVLKGARYAEVTQNGYMRDSQGRPLLMFTKNFNDGYQKVTATDENGQKAEYWVYQVEKASMPETLYTVTNLQVNPELCKNPSLLGFRLEDGSEDIATAEALRDLFSEETHTLNPNVRKRTSIVGYYSDLVAQVASERPDCRLYRINVDDEPELAAAFHVKVIPTVTCLRDGRITGTQAGACSRQQLENMLI